MTVEGRGAWPLPPEGRVVVELACPAPLAELAADRLFSLGASAVAEGALPAAGAGPVGNAEVPGGGVTLVADLDPGHLDALRQFCDDAPGPRGTVAFAVREVDPGWADAWRAHARARRVGPFVLRPPWVSEALGPGEVDLVVDPGAAFGSGSHPSTRMCLEGLAGLVAGGERVLDVGVGSGVLAVGALCLGAASALGLDIDPEAAGASRRCAAANGVAGRFRFEDASPAEVAARGDRFDLVAANLLVGTVEELGNGLAACRGTGGRLVLGGFLEEQVDRVLGAVGAGPGDVRRRLDEDGWVTLVL